MGDSKSLLKEYTEEIKRYMDMWRIDFDNKVNSLIQRNLLKEFRSLEKRVAILEGKDRNR